MNLKSGWFHDSKDLNLTLRPALHENHNGHCNLKHQPNINSLNVSRVLMASGRLQCQSRALNITEQWTDDRVMAGEPLLHQKYARFSCCFSENKITIFSVCKPFCSLCQKIAALGKRNLFLRFLHIERKKNNKANQTEFVWGKFYRADVFCPPWISSWQTAF